MHRWYMYLLCSDQDAKLSLLTVSFTEIKFQIFVESVAKQPAILIVKVGFLKGSRKLPLSCFAVSRNSVLVESVSSITLC